MNKCIDILVQWLNFCRMKNDVEKASKFWILIDFAGGLFSEEYYKNHANEAKNILEEIDIKKEQAKIVYDYLYPIVEKYLNV